MLTQKRYWLPVTATTGGGRLTKGTTCSWQPFTGGGGGKRAKGTNLVDDGEVSLLGEGGDGAGDRGGAVRVGDSFFGAHEVGNLFFDLPPRDTTAQRNETQHKEMKRNETKRNAKQRNECLRSRVLGV